LLQKFCIVELPGLRRELEGERGEKAKQEKRDRRQNLVLNHRKQLCGTRKLEKNSGEKEKQ